MAADFEGSTLTTCPVCLDDLYDRSRSPVEQKKPRALHCLHTMCEECLHSLANQTLYREIRCPQCRKVTPLTEGVRGLPVNYYIRGLHEISTSTNARSTQHAQGQGDSKPSEVITCTPCSYGGKTELAAIKCKECELNMCTACRDKHNECQLFRGHTLHVIGTIRCSTHNKDVEYVCKSCRQELCPVCLITGNHNEHLITVVSCSLVDNEARIQNDFVNVRLEQVNRDVEKAHAMEKTLLDIRRVVQEWRDDLQDQINSHVDEIVRSLHMRLLSCNYQALMQEQNNLKAEMERYQQLSKQQGLGAALKRHVWAEEARAELARPNQAHWHPVDDVPVLQMEQRELTWPTMSTKKRAVEEEGASMRGQNMSVANAGTSSNQAILPIPAPFPMPATLRLLSKEWSPKKTKVELR